MSRYSRYFGSSSYTGYLKGLSKKDRKRAEFFQSILKDNKIKKSEAKELLEKGYTERDLQRFDSKIADRAKKHYKDLESRNRASGGFSYSPFTISRGAGNVFSRGLTINEPSAPTPEPTPEPNVDPPPTPPVPTNNYQSQIDDLLQQLADDRSAAEQARIDQQAIYDQNIADLTTELTAGFQSQMQAADEARQAEIREIMSANQAQMDRMAAEQAARQQKMQIAAQTQAANAARAGQTGQFKVGGDRAGGGIGQFKRRLQIKPMASSALAIAGVVKKTAGNNKMLNV